MNSRRHVITELVDGTLVVFLQSELGSLTDENRDREFDETVEKVGQPEVRNVLMDLAKAPYFGSQVLEWMVMLWKRVRDKHGQMALCHVAPTAYDIIRVSRFNTIWPIHKTREEALESLNSGPESDGDSAPDAESASELDSELDSKLDSESDSDSKSEPESE